MSDVQRATDILRAGGLVAFPTETVYGLGADATNAAAVNMIFHVKGRPGTNPLICHVADEDVAKRYVTSWPRAAQALVDRFWPGPLTIVLPKTAAIAANVTAGLDTVGLRAPDHLLTLEMLRAFDGPVAGPSANRSTHVSPTTARHVRDEFGDEIDLILDGGPCVVGIESTVLDLSGDRPQILRPGGVSRASIEEVIGAVEVTKTVVTEVSTPLSAPGQHAKHYAPRTVAYRFDGAVPVAAPGTGAILIFNRYDGERMSGMRVEVLPQNPRGYATHLYRALRDLDAMGLKAIYVEMPPDAPEWLAVRDRLTRATLPLP